MKLETGDPQDLKCGVYRIIGNGATVQSVSRCLLVVKTAIPSIHGGMKMLQRWNHLISESSSSCLRRRRTRDTCVVLDFSPRLTQRETHLRYVRDNLTNDQLEADDGSGALLIVKTIRLAVGPKSTQEAVWLLLDFFRLDFL